MWASLTRMRVLIAALLSLATMPAVQAAAGKPNVVLVTLDTTRADRMGFLGSTRGLTPSLDALAKTGIVFERAYAQAPITTASHATILSGTYPQFHGVDDFAVPLPSDLPYVPALLQGAGYQTAAFVGSLILDPTNGLAPGFDRGFDRYDAGYQVRRGGGRSARYATLERRGAEVVSRARKWLDGTGGRPFFLWVHLYDPHDPYDPPAPFKARFARTPYDGEVASTDAAVGQLLDGLRVKKLLDDTLVVVAADHGESLGEHGESTHGVFLYDATIRVPLVVKFPRGQASGLRVSARVGLVDVAPTILQAAGVPAPSAVQGLSLHDLATSAKPTDRPAYSQTDYPSRAFGWSSLAAWRVDQFLFVEAPRRELYALDKDPSAARNIAGERTAVTGRIGDAMNAFRRETSDKARAADESKVDPDLAERLAALGYVSGGSAPRGVGGIDPKDRIATANTLHEAVLAVENGDNARAIPLLEQVVAKDPQVYMAQLQLGIARSRERKYAQAVAAFHKAIAIRPDSPVVHYEMGLALFETGDWRKAAGHFDIAATRMPKWADARFSLGSVYARIDRVGDALKELQAALDLEPDHYRANLLYGRIRTLQGDVAAAIPLLERAARSAEASAESHLFLAEAYLKAGRTEDAERERRKASVKGPAKQARKS